MQVIWTIARKKTQQTKKVFKTLNSFRHYISATKSCTVEDLLLIIAVTDPDLQSFLLFLPKISGAWAPPIDPPLYRIVEIDYEKV